MPSTPPASSERSNEEWVEALGADGQRQGAALTDLRRVVLRAIEFTVRPRVDRDAGAMAEDLTQRALLHILDRIDQFRGDARFTTWAQKVAVRITFSELRRKKWEDVSLDAMLVPPPAQESGSAQQDLERDEAIALVQNVIAKDLTDKQRTALTAVMGGMPLEEVARRMDTNRNALYKLLHDARSRIKSAIEARGLSAESVLPSDS